MNALTFRLKYDLDYTLNLQQLNPRFVKGKSLKELNLWQIQYGNTKLPLAELFAISGQYSGRVVVENSSFKLNFLGSGWDEGRLEIKGDAGCFIGAAMQNGEIYVSGSTGNYLGCSMRGGRIQVEGSTGDYLGTGNPGSKIGLVDGTVIVKGDAGYQLGRNMRRGLVIVQGDVCSGAGAGMIAGTLILLGKSSQETGLHMRRGTIICASKPGLKDGSFFRQPLPSFPLLQLIQRALNSINSEICLKEQLGATKYRYVGDLSFGGKGEVLEFTQ